MVLYGPAQPMICMQLSFQGENTAVAARRCMASIIAADLQSTTTSQTMGLTGAKKPSTRYEDLEVILLWVMRCSNDPFKLSAMMISQQGRMHNDIALDHAHHPHTPPREVRVRSTNACYRAGTAGQESSEGISK